MSRSAPAAVTLSSIRLTQPGQLHVVVAEASSVTGPSTRFCNVAERCLGLDRHGGVVTLPPGRAKRDNAARRACQGRRRWRARAELPQAYGGRRDRHRLLDEPSLRAVGKRGEGDRDIAHEVPRLHNRSVHSRKHTEDVLMTKWVPMDIDPRASHPPTFIALRHRTTAVRLRLVGRLQVDRCARG